MTGFFPEPPLFAAARRTDPPTSHAAAARAPSFRGTHQELVLLALELGPAGQTEIARRIFVNPPHVPLTPHQVNKRLGELYKDGKVVKDGLDNGGRETRYRRTGA